jgi:hypothetical protein
MAQGLRGRVALFGAGMLFCTCLVGCMSDDKPPTTPLPKARSAGQAANTNQGKTGTVPVNGNGAYGYSGQPAGGGGAYQPTGGMRQPQTYDNFGANRSATTPFGAPAVPGMVGTGGQMPGVNSVVPPVGPAGAGYSPTSSNYQSSGYPATPVSGSRTTTATTGGGYGGYGADSSASAHGMGGYNPPPPQLSDIQPPSAPGGITPSVSPAAGQYSAPLPPAPPAGAATYPYQH